MGEQGAKGRPTVSGVGGRTVWRVLVGATLTFGQGLSWGQGVDEAQSGSQSSQLAPVVVSGDREWSPSRVTTQSEGLPTPVTLIKSEDIARTNYSGEFGDLLRRTPGLMAHNIGQGSVGTSIKMRGFMSLQHGADVAVSVDGVPQNVPGSAINHGMNDLSWLTPEMIERVEVIKGPFSALYGDQARAGAINIVTRRNAGNSLALEVGRYGLARTNLVRSATIAEDIQTVFVGDLYHSGGYRDNADAQRGTLFFKASALRDEGWWSLRAVHHQAQWNAPGFLAMGGLLNGTVDPRGRDLRVPPQGGDAHRSSLVLTRDPAHGEAGWHMVAYLERYQRHRVVGVTANGTNDLEDDRWIYGGRVARNFLWGQVGALTVGGELRRDNGDASVRRAVNGTPTANFVSNYDLGLQSASLFAQAHVQVHNDVKLVGGLRLDRFDYDIGNRKLPMASLRYGKTAVSPKVGAVWSPASTVDLFANVGRGLRSPSPAELSPSGALGPLGAAGGRTNPDITPSKVASYDVGFRAWPSDRLQISGAMYHTKNDDEIVAVSPSEFASVGQTTRKGWEIEARYAWSDALSVYTSYGRISRASIDNATPGSTGKLAVPKDTLKAGVSYTVKGVAGGTLRLNADLYYLSAVPYYVAASRDYRSTSGYVRYDLRASYARGAWEYLTYAVIQPHRWSSEVAPGGAGPLINPAPGIQWGVGARYHF